MRYHVVVLSFGLNVVLCTPIGISSKLDFDGPRTTSRLVDTVNKYKSNVVYKTNKDDISTSGPKVDIVCGSNGCNTTQTGDQASSKDTIQTDVVVHVKTNVSVNTNSKTNFEDDTPDVPVIVGSPDPNRSHNQFLVGPSLEDGVVSITPPPLSPPITALNLLRPSTKTYQQNVFVPSISVESLLSEKEGARAIDNSANAVEIQIPRFEGTYHNHYFGENPPPQVLWYRKSATPDYRSRGTAKPAFWSLEHVVPTTQKYPEHGTTCTCKQHVDTGLQWYPTKRAYASPGSQINDKLARLE